MRLNRFPECIVGDCVGTEGGSKQGVRPRRTFKADVEGELRANLHVLAQKRFAE